MGVWGGWRGAGAEVPILFYGRGDSSEVERFRTHVLQHFVCTFIAVQTCLYKLLFYEKNNKFRRRFLGVRIARVFASPVIWIKGGQKTTQTKKSTSRTLCSFTIPSSSGFHLCLHYPKDGFEGVPLARHA